MQVKEYKNSDPNYVIAGSSDGFLSGLKKLNIFVGANNSGKSRYLRKVYTATTDEFVFYEDFNKELDDIFNRLEPRFKGLYSMQDLVEMKSSKAGNYAERFNQFMERIELVDRSTSSTGSVSNLDVALEIKSEMRRLAIYKKIDLGDGLIDGRHIYIPILRGLRHLDYKCELHSEPDFYRNSTIKDYKLKVDESNEKEVFSGLSIYQEIKKMLLGSRDERKFINNFEKFLSESFFQDVPLTLVPDFGNAILKINIGGEKDDKAIFDVGDGVQSIIINTFQAFRYQDENLRLFIEEPEMMMHPSIQRILIETLITRFDKLQVFLTTHSNHFLDLTYDYPDDVAIFSFEEVGDDKFKIDDVGVNVKILDLLGVRNSSVFLSNCVIWVEGVTDRMLLKKLLLLAEIEHKEDKHYSFAEYGGSNLENFDFIDEETPNGLSVKSIARTNYIVVDNDNIKEDTEGVEDNKKYNRRKKIRTVLGNDRFFDQHIEIENLIPYKVWVEVVKRLLADEPKKKIQLKDVQEGDEEKFNSQLSGEKIGKLLKDFLIEAKGKNPPKYFESENVQCLDNSKKKIMGYVLDVIDDLELKLDDFPEEARKLIEFLKKFIGGANS